MIAHLAAYAFAVLCAGNVLSLIIIHFAERLALQILKRTDTQAQRMKYAQLRNSARRLLKAALSPGLKERVRRAALIELAFAILLLVIF